MEQWLKVHIEWSRKTFGEGMRTLGLCKHIASELEEIKKAPKDLEEWIDVLVLGFDGAWRAGYTPKEIIAMLEFKQAKNMKREYPKPTSEDEPSFHKK